MRKVKVSLPAALTTLGAGVRGLGLALGLRTTVELIERGDDAFTVETAGEGAGSYSTGLRHPVVTGMARVFQRLERAPVGLTIRIDSRIPPDSGLGADAVFGIAGLIGANTLYGNPFTREQMLTMAALVYGAEVTAAALLGGLVASRLDGDTLLCRSLPVAPMQIAIVLPKIDGYAPRAAPERAPLADALHGIASVPLLIDALRAGDFGLLAQVMDDRLIAPARQRDIPGYEHVASVAKRSGASAITLCGDGAALAVFAPANHTQIAGMLRAAFASAGVEARTWIVPVDTQGVVISAAQT